MSRPFQPSPESLSDALAQVHSVYADLAARPLERSCQARTTCCRFRLTGKTPMLTWGEALYAAKAVRAMGWKALPSPGSDRAEAETEGRCPLLDEGGRCRIYEGRPFGCRTHFCEPAGGAMAREEVRDLIQRLEALAERHGETDPRPLRESVEAALQALPNKRGNRGRRRH